MKHVTTILFLLIVVRVLAQTPSKEYYDLVIKADSLYTAKEYKNSAAKYSTAFKTFGWMALPGHRYKAAQAWAMAGNPDSAFFSLDRLVKRSVLVTYESLVDDKAFNSLHGDRRWKPLVDLVKENKTPNFGFERIKSPVGLPVNWFEWGTRDYAFRVDSVVKHGGKYSLLIEPTENIKEKSFGCATYAIPPNYTGSEIEVRTYIKMENVEKPLGFMLRIDGASPNQSLGFDNMQQKNIKGTVDWTLYSVKLPLPAGATGIYIGTFLSGTGKVWADDFQVLIDGKDISQK